MRRIEPTRPPWRLLVAIGALPGLIAVLQLGRLHPDEVYQYLEPANWKAFGYGILAWEWQPQGGLRNWAIPGVFAVLLKLCAAIGIDDPWKRRVVLELPQAALHVWMLYAAWRLASRRVNEHVARWAVALVGLYMPVLTFAGRTLGESFSAAFLVIGLELLDREKEPRAPAYGGAVLGLAVVARYGSAAAVIGAMLFLLARRRFRDFGLATAGGAVVALALGALDWATWGAPFHSLRQYLDFNVFSGKAAAQFGQDPFTIYLPYLAMLAPWFWLSLPKKPSGIFVAAGVAYLAAIFLTKHKEPRFIYPALIILSVGAVAAALEFLAKRGPGLTAAACVASLVFFFADQLQVPRALCEPPQGQPACTFDNQLKPQRPDQFRLTARIWPDATGFFIIPEGTWGAPGFFWLGKNIPWFTCDFPQQFQPAVADPRFNRALNYDHHYDAELSAAGFRVLQQDGRATLWGR